MPMFKRDTDCNSYSLLCLYVVCITRSCASCGFIKSLGNVPSLFVLGKYLRNIGISSSLKV